MSRLTAPIFSAALLLFSSSSDRNTESLAVFKFGLQDYAPGERVLFGSQFGTVIGRHQIKGENKYAVAFDDGLYEEGFSSYDLYRLEGRLVNSHLGVGDLVVTSEGYEAAIVGFTVNSNQARFVIRYDNGTLALGVLNTQLRLL